MKRDVLIALVIGWLLGITTAFAIPTLVYQRQSIVREVTASGTRDALQGPLNDGWYVIREDSQSITLERPRFRIP